MSMQAEIINRRSNLRWERIYMIPNEHSKTRKTHVLLTVISRWVPRTFAVSPTLVRYLSRNYLVRNFGKGFQKLTSPKDLLSPMEWLGPPWLFVSSV